MSTVAEVDHIAEADDQSTDGHNRVVVDTAAVNHAFQNPQRRHDVAPVQGRQDVTGGRDVAPVRSLSLASITSYFSVRSESSEVRQSPRKAAKPPGYYCELHDFDKDY